MNRNSKPYFGFGGSAIYLLTTLLMIQAAAAEDSPHWRGVSRNDVSGESSGWKEGAWPRKEVWTASVGEGSSSAVVIGHQVCLTGWAGDQDTLRCLNLHTGVEIWKQSYTSPRYGRFSVGDKSLYSGACSTPEFDGDTGFIFTLGVDGDLIAWDTAATGRKVWSLNLYDNYGAQRRPEVARRKKTQRDYGYNIATAAVYEDSVIITSAYNHVAMCRLKITKSGAAKVWENTKASGVCVHH